MKKSKIVSLLLVTMMVLAMLPSGAVFANDFTVISTSPADETGAVSVLEDLTIEFSSEVDSSTITPENVIISGGNASFTVSMQSDTIAVLEFENALDYETTYTIELTSNITDTQQTPLNQTEISFTTEHNPITLLFEEDFNGDPAQASARFVDMGRENALNYFVVENNALRIFSQTEVGGFEERPKVMIVGSGNWTDYIVKADVMVSTERGYPQILTRFTDNTHFYENRLYFETLNGNNDGALIRKCDGNYTQLYISTRTNYFIRNKIYPWEVTVTGNQYSFSAETENDTLTTTITDSALSTGGVAFSNTRYSAIFDNIVIHDKGFIFTPSALKNTQDVITLNFNDSIDFDTVEGNVAVSDINGPVNFYTSPNGLTALDIQIENAQLDAFYTISVGDGITNAAGTKSLTNEKIFDIKTAKQVNTFAVESTYPLNGETNVSILEDVTFEFTNSVDINTLTSANINVSDDVAFSIMLKSPNKITLSFDDGLNFNKTYTASLTSGVKDVFGNPLPESSISFSTARDTMSILFEEDFSGDPATALARFEQVGQMDPIGESYDVIDNALSITAEAFHLDDYDGLPEGHPSNGYESRPILQIKGSENWTDYEVEFDVCRYTARSWANVVFRFQDYNNFYEARFQADTIGNGNDRVFIRRFLSRASTEFNTTPTDNLFSRYVFYPAKLTVIGNEYTQTIETNDGTKTVTATSSDWASGGIGFSNYRYTARFDNIVVYDKGFLFTPSRVKNVTNALTLNFNDDVNFDTIENKIIVSNEFGPVDTIISQHGSRGVNIALVDTLPDTIYTVEVDKGIENLQGKTMTSDKTFQFRTELSTVNNIAIKSETSPVISLTADSSIYASADISYYRLTGQQDYTLILAVYDDQGYLYDLSFVKETLYAGDSDSMPITTPAINLPSNVTGYKARAFVWDNMVNIKPISFAIQI